MLHLFRCYVIELALTFLFCLELDNQGLVSGYNQVLREVNLFTSCQDCTLFAVLS